MNSLFSVRSKRKSIIQQAQTENYRSDCLKLYSNIISIYFSSSPSNAAAAAQLLSRAQITTINNLKWFTYRRKLAVDAMAMSKEKSFLETFGLLSHWSLSIITGMRNEMRNGRLLSQSANPKAKLTLTFDFSSIFGPEVLSVRAKWFSFFDIKNERLAGSRR